MAVPMVPLCCTPDAVSCATVWSSVVVVVSVVVFFSLQADAMSIAMMATKDKCFFFIVLWLSYNY